MSIFFVLEPGVTLVPVLIPPSHMNHALIGRYTSKNLVIKIYIFFFINVSLFDEFFNFEI
jgi:hypothetical protein